MLGSVTFQPLITAVPPRTLRSIAALGSRRVALTEGRSSYFRRRRVRLSARFLLCLNLPSRFKYVPSIVRAVAAIITKINRTIVRLLNPNSLGRKWLVHFLAFSPNIDWPYQLVQGARSKAAVREFPIRTFPCHQSPISINLDAFC